MITTILASLGFWIITSIAILLMFFCMSTRLGGTGATFTFLLFLGALYLFKYWALPLAIWANIIANPLVWIFILLGYLIIGLLWSFAKWHYYIVQMKKYGADLESWRVCPGDNKSRIIAWMSYWPFSFIATMIDNPVKKLFQGLFSKFEDVYQSITDKVYKKDKSHLVDH